MRQMSRLSLGFLMIFAICGAAQAAEMKFTANLAAGPGVTSAGKGTATATLDTATKRLTWDVEYSGLSGPVMAAHIHGPADPGKDAGVQVPFTGSLASPIRGSATLTDAQISQLEAGKYYVNLHTAANKGGEIRGQLMPSS